jgi:hypothetical protein
MTIAVALIAAAARSSAAGSFDLIEPAPPPIREIEEVGASPHYYRLPPNTVGLLSRTTMGVHTRLTGEIDSAPALDLLVGASIRFGRDSALGIWIEGGYAVVRGREHLAVLGVGLARKKPGWMSSIVAVIPHVVAGTIDGESCLGLRTSVVLGLPGYLSLELAHQVAFVGDEPMHELHFGMSFPFVRGGG